MVKKFLWFFSLVPMVFLLTSCGPIKTPPSSSYLISNLNLGKMPTTAKTNLTLLVSNPIANSGYQTSAMIYMITPYELKVFSNNRWVAPPAQMLLPIIVQALREQGYFYAVVAPPFSGLTNYRLDTQLIKLQQEFLLPTSRVRLVMQATLISNVSNKVVATRLFEAMVSAPANNPYSGVLAANQAASMISQAIARFSVSHTH